MVIGHFVILDEPLANAAGIFWVQGVVLQAVQLEDLWDGEIVLFVLVEVVPKVFVVVGMVLLLVLLAVVMEAPVQECGFASTLLCRSCF